jgi:hypothetical protein
MSIIGNSPQSKDKKLTKHKDFELKFHDFMDNSICDNSIGFQQLSLSFTCDSYFSGIGKQVFFSPGY